MNYKIGSVLGIILFFQTLSNIEMVWSNGENLSFGVAIGVINNTTETIVSGSAQLISAGNVTLHADNRIVSNVKAHGHEASQDSSGAYSTVNVIAQNARAEVLENAAISAEKDLSVKATEISNAETTAVSGAPKEDASEENSGEGSGDPAEGESSEGTETPAGEGGEGAEGTEGVVPLSAKETAAWEKEMAAGEQYYEKIQKELNGK